MKLRIGSTGRIAEKRLARRIGGRQTPNSGAMVGAKGDVETDKFLIEAKSTIKLRLTLEHDWLAKIGMEALEAGKAPACAINFTTGDGQPIKFGSWVLIRETEFQELLDDAARR
jgi:hypothetical protein